MQKETKTEVYQAADDFLMSPKVDFCFKELFQSPKVRQGFLAAILGKNPGEIVETQLMQTILSKESADSKYGILDVRVLMTNGSQIDLEMQVAPLEYWDKRMIFYLSKMYTEQIQEGDDYDKIKKCVRVHVSILDFNHFKDDNKCYREIAFCDLENGEKYTDLLEIHVMELKKLPEEQTDEPLLIKWMRFLAANRKEDFEKMAEQDQYIGEAYETLKKLSADETKRLEYEVRQKALRDKNAIEDYGYHRGEKAGEELGRSRVNRLNAKLLEEDRLDDLKESLLDTDYQQKLFLEFGL